MIIDGKKIAEEALTKLREEVYSRNLNLQMAAVLVSDKPELRKFVELKEKAARSVGVGFKSYFFDENIPQDELKDKVEKISSDKDIDGVFIELPLPGNIDSQDILNVIPIEKDLDALSQKAQDKFFSGDFSILSPAAESVRMVFEKYNINPSGKKIAVFGHGFLIGKPVSFWLEKQGAEVLIIRSKTENPAEISKNADIIISGVGKPGLIKESMVKSGAIVVDFGYGKLGDKMVGDVNFDSVSSTAGLITPVPGGMGPILVAAVLKNLIYLNKLT